MRWIEFGEPCAIAVNSLAIGIVRICSPGYAQFLMETEDGRSHKADGAVCNGNTALTTHLCAFVGWPRPLSHRSLDH